jgi:hypothetical protein
MSVDFDETLVGWGDLVFHVLAHVRGTRHLAASVYDRTYLDFVACHVGPAEARTLGEDAWVLGRAAATHEALGAVQLLAWLHETVEAAEAVADRGLRQLGPRDVDVPGLLLVLLRWEATVEVLRCAALLEREAWAALPCEPDAAGMRLALSKVVPAAPGLEVCRVRMVRALRLRGRVRADEIWVGVPMTALGLTTEHAAWQAAHEATVREVSTAMTRKGRVPTFDEVERVAVVLLASRASTAGLGREHAVWYGSLGHPPSTHVAALSPFEAEMYRDLVLSPLG